MAGRDIDEMEQEADYYALLARIEALRDEWRAEAVSQDAMQWEDGSDGYDTEAADHGARASSYRSHAAALDALLGGAG